MDYATNPSYGSRLVIYGENGTGKSHIAKSVARWAKRCAVLMKHVSSKDEVGTRLPICEFHNWARTVDKLWQGDWFTIEDMMPVELLILDDVGAEHDPRKCAGEKLYLLLESREYKWTIITTNYGPESWEDKFERRIASRFLRNTVHVPLDQVPDYNSIL